MPKQTRPGQSLIAIYIPEATRAAWDAFVSERTSTLKAEIVVAMARHIASPPPKPEAAPLPVKRPRGRPKKNLAENV